MQAVLLLAAAAWGAAGSLSPAGYRTGALSCPPVSAEQALAFKEAVASAGVYGLQRVPVPIVEAVRAMDPAVDTQRAFLDLAASLGESPLVALTYAHMMLQEQARVLAELESGEEAALSAQVEGLSQLETKYLAFLPREDWSDQWTPERIARARRAKAEALARLRERRTLARAAETAGALEPEGR